MATSKKKKTVEKERVTKQVTLSAILYFNTTQRMRFEKANGRIKILMEQGYPGEGWRSIREYSTTPTKLKEVIEILDKKVMTQ